MQVELIVSKRVKGSWDRGIRMLVDYDTAVQMVKNSINKNFDSTKIGELVVTQICGTLSTILSVKSEAGIE